MGKFRLNKIKAVLKLNLISGIIILQGVFLPLAYAGLTVLHTFPGNLTDGLNPSINNNVVLDGTTFYGFVAGGGDNNRGIAFSMETDGTSYSILYEFGASTNPETPVGTPLFLNVGGTDYLYGMSKTGGTNDNGTVFRLQTDGTMEILHSFTADTTTDGDSPWGTLAVSGSTLYGVTRLGGANDHGCIFKIDTDGSNFAVLWDFEDAVADNGSFPRSGVILSGDFIYGMTYDGGANSDGTAYKYSISGDTFTTLREFSSYWTDGSDPYCDLMLSGSTLYGSTASGSFTSGKTRGTLFKVDTDGTSFTNLWSFANASDDGDTPYGDLTLYNGKLYGMTYWGGTSNKGVIYEIETDGSNFTVIYSFAGGAGSGAFPQGSLLLDGDTFYGLTAQGGSANAGVIFSYAFPALDHLTVTGSGSQTAGGSQTVTVTAKKDDGSTDTTYTGDKSITFSGPAAAPDGTVATFSDKNAADVNIGSATTLTFSSGVATSTMKVYKVETVNVDADDGSIDSTGAASYDLGVTVSAASLSDYTVTATTPQTQYTGWSETVTGRDTYQNTVTNDSSSTATMTETGEALFYTDGTYAIQTTTYTLSSGTVTIYIKNYDAETITVTTTTGGASGTSGNIVVNSASISPSISSAANQEFRANGSSTAISAITVTDDASTAGINTVDDIRITIPSGFNMTWDTSDTTASFSGTASAKASTTVSYEDSNRTLVIDVTSDFSAGQTLIVSGLSFNNFTAVSAADNLELEMDNAGTVADTDDKTITIIIPTDRLVVTGVATQISGGSQTITVTAKDADGDTDTGYTGDKSITFSGANASGSNNPTCSDKNASDVNFGTATTITFSSGVATSTMKLYASESISIDATDGTYTTTGSAAYDLDVIVVNPSISSPAADSTVGTQPTIIGSTDAASQAYTIKGTSGSSTVTVASGTSDSSGNFSAQVNSGTLLDTGSNTLQLYVGVAAGPSVAVTVEGTSSSTNVPTVTNIASGTAITTNPFTVSGVAAAGSEVRVQALDESGNVLLNCGSATADSSTGAYSISVDAVTSGLAAGTNTLSVTTYDSLGSAITSSLQITVTFTDPFGIVFNSTTDNPIEGAVVTLYYDNDSGAGRDWITAVSGTHIPASESNPQTTGSDGYYSYNCIDGDFYIDIAAPGYTYASSQSSFPSGRTVITGSKGEVFTVAGVIIEMDHPMDLNASLVTVTKDANKKEISVGDIVTYTVIVNNTTGSATATVYIEDKIPAGFKYLKGKARLDGSTIADPTGNRRLTFNLGTIAANTTKTLKYQLVVGSGVSFGNYENVVWAKYSNGDAISNTASETVKIIPDPMFDLGTIIGKVFNDRNQNGKQDKGEELIANAQIVTAQGAVITTDQDGKYHLAGLTPGRHLLRIDKKSLPKGAKTTTKQAVIVNITQGLLAKVNFGVRLADSKDKVKEPFRLIFDRGIPKPRLSVALVNDQLVIENGELKQPVEFRIFTNYQLFINKWRLRIIDKHTRRVVKIFTGTQSDIFKPIYWDGMVDGKAISENREYLYYLTVVGQRGNKDTTRKLKLPIVRQGQKDEKTESEIKEQRSQWFKAQSQKNNLEKQSVFLNGETIKIVSQDSQLKGVRIVQDKKLIVELPLNKEKAQSKVDIIIPQGQYLVETDSDSGYKQEIGVGDQDFFLVAMADAKVGYTFHSGSIEPVDHDDEFHQGFWSEGKLSYYLKGKIKGKYLITSSLDTQRNQKELFRDLDPDKYYPVYGDSSSVDYQANNTQGYLYLLVEWDKSKVLWGNYRTDLIDTEFSQFRRSLYGGKVQLESLSTTKFGEPTSKVIAFKASAKQRASQDQFLGTGGSLYYLKNKNLIEGSDKIRVEVRDQTTGSVLSSSDIQSDSDYEIDYSQGRIVFRQPVMRLAESDSIVAGSLLSGNPLYVVCDYEYQVKDKYYEATYGLRLKQSLGDYITAGVTYVEEELLKENYQLRGADLTLKLGPNIKLTAEYAESESEATGSFISTDGGLSFRELPTGEFSSGEAYGLKVESYSFENRLGLTAYYKFVDSEFSSSATSSQTGKELSGFEATYDLDADTRIKLSHDIQKLVDDGNTQTQLQVGAKESQTSRVQVSKDLLDDRLKLTTEYQHQEVVEKKEQFDSETNRETGSLAVKADYKLNDKVDLSLKQQMNLKGPGDNQTILGIESKINQRLSLRVKEAIGTEGAASSIGMVLSSDKTDSQDKPKSLLDSLFLSGDYTKTIFNSGQVGDSISLGTELELDDKTDLHGSYSLAASGSEGGSQSFTFGSTRKLSDRLEFSADRDYASSDKESKTSNIFSLSGDIDQRWSAQASYERGVVQNHDTTKSKRQAVSLGIGFIDKDNVTGKTKLKSFSKVELRLDDGQENERQYLLRNKIEGKLNPETTLFAEANWSQSKNSTTDSTTANYKEFSLGAAYRPLKIDRINLLARYTYLDDNSPASQTDINDILKEKSHTLAIEAVYDLTDKWQLSEKLAYKMAEEMVSGFDFTDTETWLMVHRLNYNIDHNWQIGGEYRILGQEEAEDYKHGALIEVNRRIGDFVQLGVGYNFTKFNDDLTHLDYTVHGPFVRATTIFFERTPEEIAAAREEAEKKRKESSEAKKQKQLGKRKKRRWKTIVKTLVVEDKKFKVQQREKERKELERDKRIKTELWKIEDNLR
jgi:uncharacterized repeat protein (TIGR03803 family)